MTEAVLAEAGRALQTHAATTKHSITGCSSLCRQNNSHNS